MAGNSLVRKQKKGRIQPNMYQMEQRAVVCLSTLKDLKAKKIEMELTSVYGDEALRISAVKK
jgi:hypothetical protein